MNSEFRAMVKRRYIADLQSFERDVNSWRKRAHFLFKVEQWANGEHHES